jgi:hypothetical protein
MVRVRASQWCAPVECPSVTYVTNVDESRSGSRGLKRAIEDHLASRDSVRVIYGAIIGLALVVALETHPPTAGQTVAALVATAVAVGLAELYSEYVGVEARGRRHVRRSEVAGLALEALAVTFGAAFPAVFFLLAMAGAWELDTAYTLAKWTGLGLICAYGFVASRLAGSTLPGAGLHAAALGVIGVVLISLKALLH